MRMRRDGARRKTSAAREDRTHEEPPIVVEDIKGGWCSATIAFKANATKAGLGRASVGRTDFILRNAKNPHCAPVRAGQFHKNAFAPPQPWPNPLRRRPARPQQQRARPKNAPKRAAFTTESQYRLLDPSRAALTNTHGRRSSQSRAQGSKTQEEGGQAPEAQAPDRRQARGRRPAAGQAKKKKAKKAKKRAIGEEERRRRTGLRASMAWEALTTSARRRPPRTAKAADEDDAAATRRPPRTARRPSRSRRSPTRTPLAVRHADLRRFTAGRGHAGEHQEDGLRHDDEDPGTLRSRRCSRAAIYWATRRRARARRRVPRADGIVAASSFFVAVAAMAWGGGKRSRRRRRVRERETRRRRGERRHAGGAARGHCGGAAAGLGFGLAFGRASVRRVPTRACRCRSTRRRSVRSRGARPSPTEPRQPTRARAHRRPPSAVSRDAAEAAAARGRETTQRHTPRETGHDAKNTTKKTQVDLLTKARFQRDWAASSSRRRASCRCRSTTCCASSSAARARRTRTAS